MIADFWWLPGYRRISQRPRRGHPAVDLAAQLGSPILAPAPGRVRAVRWDPTGYGLYADIELAPDRFYRIAHMQRAYVVPGQVVQLGQPIGEVGSTGRSTGPHVHFEVRGPSGKPEDPEEFLRRVSRPSTGPTWKMPLGVGLMIRFAIPAAGLAAQRAGASTGAETRDPRTFARVLAAVPPSAADVTRYRVQEAARALAPDVRRLAVGAAGVAMMLIGFLILAWGLREQVLSVIPAGQLAQFLRRN